MEEKKSLQSELIRLRNQEILDEFSYYCICFLGTKDGKILYYIISSWFGFTETKPKRELRAPCKVNVKSALELLKEVNWLPLIVNDKRDLTLFFLIGGYALIIDKLFESHFSKFLKPKEVGFHLLKGFQEILDESPINDRVPSKKMRMKIFKRDHMRCRICGRSPKEYLDVELHLHHINPWGRGGLTEEDNLITLCKSCHDGLEPHNDPTLYNYISDSIEETDYIEGVKNYWKIIRNKYFKK